MGVNIIIASLPKILSTIQGSCQASYQEALLFITCFFFLNGRSICHFEFTSKYSSGYILQLLHENLLIFIIFGNNIILEIYGGGFDLLLSLPFFRII